MKSFLKRTFDSRIVKISLFLLCALLSIPVFGNSKDKTQAQIEEALRVPVEGMTQEKSFTSSQPTQETSSRAAEVLGYNDWGKLSHYYWGGNGVNLNVYYRGFDYWKAHKTNLEVFPLMEKKIKEEITAKFSSFPKASFDKPEPMFKEIDSKVENYVRKNINRVFGTHPKVTTKVHIVEK